MQLDLLLKILDSLKISHNLNTALDVDTALWTTKILTKQPTFEIEYLSPDIPMPCLSLRGSHNLSTIDKITIEALLEHQYQKAQPPHVSITSLTSLAQTFPYPNTTQTPYYAILSLILSQITLPTDTKAFKQQSIPHYTQYGISIHPITYKNTEWDYFYCESAFHGTNQLVLTIPRNKYMAYNITKAIVEYLIYTISPSVIPTYLLHFLIVQSSYNVLEISQELKASTLKSSEMPSHLANTLNLPLDFATSLARICNTQATLKSKA